jgi:hypothetical protein
MGNFVISAAKSFEEECMFNFLKSGLGALTSGAFNSDMDVLTNHMPIDEQIYVYHLMKDDYEAIKKIVASESSDATALVRELVTKAMKNRNEASAIWNDKRNADWMAASLIEHLGNPILSGDVNTFGKIYAKLDAWCSAMDAVS